MGHPYYDVIDNSTEFETKMRRLTKVGNKLINKGIVGKSLYSIVQCTTNYTGLKTECETGNYFM